MFHKNWYNLVRFISISYILFIIIMFRLKLELFIAIVTDETIYWILSRTICLYFRSIIWRNILTKKFHLCFPLIALSPSLLSYYFPPQLSSLDARHLRPYYFLKLIFWFFKFVITLCFIMFKCKPYKQERAFVF